MPEPLSSACSLVAVSIAPEQMVTCRAPVERQAVAGSAFTALSDAFFISLLALIPHLSVGTLIVPFICLLPGDDADPGMATLETAKGLAEFPAQGLSGRAQSRPLWVRTAECVAPQYRSLTGG